MATKKHQPLEIGVLSVFRNADVNPFLAVAQHNVAVTQMLNWDMSLWTDENARRLKRYAKETGVRINSFWAGYSGLCVWGDFLRGPETLGLVPPATRKQRVKDLKRGAEMAADCGVCAIATHCGFIPETAHFDPLYQPTIDAIGDVAAYCQKLGIGFWFETGQETPTTLLRAITDIGLPNLGINYDTANLILYGKANSVDALDILSPYIRCTHAKDGLYPTGPYKCGVQTPLGKGKANLPRLLPKLRGMGYDGDLIIEREISGPQQIKDINKATKYLKRLTDRIFAKEAAAKQTVTK